MDLFEPNEDTKDYHIRKPNVEDFLFDFEDKKFIYMGENLLSFETNVKVVKYSSEVVLNDIKCPLAYGEENIYFMLHRKYIPFPEYEFSTEKKTSMSICIKKMTN